MGKRFIAFISFASLAGSAMVASADADVQLDSKFVEALTRPGAARHAFSDASGRLPITIELAPGTDARAMGWQPFAPGLASLRVAPSDLAAFEAAHPDARFWIWPRFHSLLDQSAKLNGTVAYRQALAAAGSPLGGTGKGVVVGIIDTGLDVKHPDFRDASGKTRVAWLLDMSQPAVRKHPYLETAFGCTDPMQTPCAVFDASDIDAALTDPVGVPPKDAVGHGTHVASIAAGNGGGGASARFVGGAPDATLIIAGVTHGLQDEGSDADIATGARFIFDRADQMGMPAVINLSLGGDFGPHDGTTPLEKSLAAMVGHDHPGHAIVVAAGNSGTLYYGDTPEQTLGIHTHVRVNPGLPAEVPILSPGDPHGPDISGTVFIWATFEKTEDVAVSVEGPRGMFIGGVHAGHQGSFSSADNRLKAAIFNSVTQQDLPLTPETHGAVIAWDGAWPAGSEMKLRFEGEGLVDAWVQTALDASDDEADFEVSSREGTINVPATHPDLIAVGCTVNRTSWTDIDGNDFDLSAVHDYDGLSPVDSTCYFSSAGPTATGVMKPEISAPGAFVAAAMSGSAVPGNGQTTIFDAPAGTCKKGNQCLVVDSGHALLSGSSMSSPQVAGAVALFLERDPSLTQPEILRLLEQGARRPTGTVGADYQLGVGALDVAGAMQAYDARTSPIARDPDPAASWMSLSDGYAHPDARWSVSGTIELRASDGAIADGFDAHRISLSVDHAVITQPLSRIDAGIWRFALTGAPDTGGGSMRIDARFDGVPIGKPGSKLYGQRTLPIGADLWTAAGTARAYGGCSISPASLGTSCPTPRVFVLALAGALSAGSRFAARRRRARRSRRRTPPGTR
jgi:subtilisin family serine protease